ncbi:trihelix transcription factor GTL1 [Cornus florida]|uniref:trihelix transcription factor GTL1 n=1 Tax=Cornus florida TaxID=4283 RepID=UPI0028963C94|nr:trihelix transcription factor GTL1 [Cornus florida]
MELFTGDRRVPNEVGFPDNLTPFPETSDILYGDRTCEIHPPEIEQHHSQLPPQKLRPIRCNGRNLPEYSDPTAMGAGGVDGALMNYHGVASSELGFLTQLSAQTMDVVSGGPRENNSSQANILLFRNGGPGVAGVNSPPVYVPPLQQIKAEMEADCVKLISQGRLLEAELSSSSDDGGESSEATTEPLNRKRKRKGRKKLELFLENITEKVIQRQEQMHKQLIELIEKKESERIIREEAWKQREIERAKREEEVRAQETSRNLALISFIQNLLGHELTIPKQLEASTLDKDDGEIHSKQDFRCDPSYRRWPKSEVQALITVRTALEHKFLKAPKGSVWEDVAVELCKMGYSRTAKKCKEKWENINKYYRKTMESGKKRLDYGKTCPYFNELDVLYKSGLINPGNASSYISNETEIEDKNVKEVELSMIGT